MAGRWGARVSLGKPFAPLTSNELLVLILVFIKWRVNEDHENLRIDLTLKLFLDTGVLLDAWPEFDYTNDPVVLVTLGRLRISSHVIW